MLTQHLKDTRILDLIKIPQEERNIEWLKNSLATAIELELATMPPYLCAWFSIKNSQEPAAGVIRSILVEEMFHMGLVCNMLKAIGGDVEIKTPMYPGPLPGGIRPHLTVYLSHLSETFLSDVCMQIEYPEGGSIALFRGLTYPTIGAFYDAILETFQNLNPTLTASNQLATNIGSNDLKVMATLEDIENAIIIIKEQGEGTSQSPDIPGVPDEKAHYYKFAEIYNGRELIQKNAQWVYEGAEIPFPETYPMAQVPSGGWVNPPQEVQTLLNNFNEIYSTILGDIETAWNTGNLDILNAAIGQMFRLGALATQLMQIPLADGSGNYGPDFLYLG